MKQNKEFIWKSDKEDGTYQNPVICTDYSDPDVIRVGDRFFLTASSFNCVPGLPILCSYDLINWQIVNYACNQLPFEVYNTPAHAKGVWAPSIRYHDGKYWIFFAMPDEGIFMTTAVDPLGTWEPLTCVKKVKGWIDPCPLWDDDGQAYLVHAFANSRCGIHSKLKVCRMAPDGTSLLDDGQIVFDGTQSQPTIEGPKFYKREGFYYIFAPAGGVKQGWQTVLRSKEVFGPYEEKIVMHQGDTAINGPHQGGLVDTVNGEDWFLHFQDAGVLGRIVHVQPVKWENGWPIIGIDQNGDGIGEPVLNYKKPYSAENVQPCEPQISDDFEQDKLGLQWQWYANYQPEFYSLTERKGFLRLFNRHTEGEQSQLLWNTPNMLTQKIACPAFTVKVKLDISALKPGDQSGLVIIGGQYAYLAVQKTEDGCSVFYVRSSGDIDHKTEQQIEKLDLSTKSAVYLMVEMKRDGTCLWSCSTDDEVYTACGQKDTFVAVDCVWVGAKIGLFAINADETKGGFTDFDYIHIAANTKTFLPD